RATRDFLTKLIAASPDTTVLVDEAYFDYVTDPDHETHAPFAIQHPQVIVARTFSKAYGMAGLRQGDAIAHPETIKKLRMWTASGGTGSLNVFGMAAATVAIQQDASFTTNERNRNKAVRDMATKWFADRGMKPTDCQANFMFVNIGTPAKAFREATRAKGVMVARDFPPFHQTHARITLGTPARRRACRARRTATGPTTPPTSAAPSTCRSIRSTPRTSTRWKSRGASRPTTSVRAPSSSSKGRRSRSAARCTRRRARGDRSSRSTDAPAS